MYNPIILIFSLLLGFTLGIFQKKSKDIKISQKDTYVLLYKYRKHLTEYKEKFKNGLLSYKDYPEHEVKRDIMLLTFKDCKRVLNWLEKGEIMVRALNSRSSINNDIIYDVYTTKLLDLTKSCK